LQKENRGIVFCKTGQVATPGEREKGKREKGYEISGHINKQEFFVDALNGGEGGNLKRKKWRLLATEECVAIRKRCEAGARQKKENVNFTWGDEKGICEVEELAANAKEKHSKKTKRSGGRNQRRGASRHIANTSQPPNLERILMKEAQKRKKRGLFQ